MHTACESAQNACFNKLERLRSAARAADLDYEHITSRRQADAIEARLNEQVAARKESDAARKEEVMLRVMARRAQPPMPSFTLAELMAAYDVAQDARSCDGH